MPNIESLDLSNPRNVKFKDLKRLCEYHFGEGRNTGGSHLVFPTPWKGDPFINIQPSKRDKKMAVPYQVKNVRDAIEKKKELGL